MIPDVVMNGLKVPLVGSSLNVDSNYRVAKQVCALAVSSVKTTDGRSHRQVQEPALLVECEVERPDIDAQSPFPAISFPSVVTDGSGLRHRTEFPELCSCACIKC